MAGMQIVCNLYSVFFSHSCVHAGRAGHGNDLAYGRFNNFPKIFLKVLAPSCELPTVWVSRI